MKHISHNQKLCYEKFPQKNITFTIFLFKSPNNILNLFSKAPIIFSIYFQTFFMRVIGNFTETKISLGLLLRVFQDKNNENMNVFPATKFHDNFFLSLRFWNDI